MSDHDDALELVDELTRLLDGSAATTIEVETSSLSVTVTRSRGVPAATAEATGRRRDEPPDAPRVQRVHATTVGIFSAPQEWRKGDPVQRGAVLGAIQSLGHMVDITAPADGKIQEVLVAIGAPVEYGQALFAIALP